MLGITRRSNAQVAPGVLTQLEVFRAKWGFRRYLSPRAFFALRLNDETMGVKTPGEVAAAAAAGEDVSIMRISLLRRYETRRMRHLPPPVAQRAYHGRFRGAGSWKESMRTCSLCEWADVTQKDIARCVHSHNPARVVEIKPCLNFSAPEAKRVEHYQSACRIGILAYAAFPNSEWRTASELIGVPGATCEASFAAFVSDEPRTAIPTPTEQWGVFPSFLRSKWGSSKARDTRVGKAELRKREEAIPAAKRGSVRFLTWDLCMGGPLIEARVGGAMEVLRSKRHTSSAFNRWPLGYGRFSRGPATGSHLVSDRRARYLTHATMGR